MVKVRHSRLQAIKLSTFTLVSSMLFMLTFVLLVLLGLGIFSLRSSSEGFPPNDLSSYRRMTSEREGDRMEKKEEKWTEILSWEPRAFLYHNFLSKEECEYLINLATVVDAETGRSIDSRVRTSTGMFLDRGQDRVIRDIEKRIADFFFIPVDVEEGGETVFPYADVNISSVPWWNELSECAKQGLSLKPKRAMHCFSGAQDLMPSDASSLHGKLMPVPLIKLL